MNTITYQLDEPIGYHYLFKCADFYQSANKSICDDNVRLVKPNLDLKKIKLKSIRPKINLRKPMQSAVL